jgi:FixJ family two-component response regulator
MDGVELATKLAGAGHAQRFLFISGYCDGSSLPDRSGDLPATAFLAKPFSIPDLMKSFRALLEQEPAGRRVASLRERRAPSALRRPAAPIDAVRALERKSRPLQAGRDTLLEDSR